MAQSPYPSDETLAWIKDARHFALGHNAFLWGTSLMFANSFVRSDKARFVLGGVTCAFFLYATLFLFRLQMPYNLIFVVPLVLVGCLAPFLYYVKAKPKHVPHWARRLFDVLHKVMRVVFVLWVALIWWYTRP